MMYAQRGHGKRSSYYSDYTFGCWTEDGELLPVGKAYSGFTDEELIFLDRFVRNSTVNRFGPVREVEKTLVLRSEEHTSELQSLMRISYAVFCLKKKNKSIYIKTPSSMQNKQN